MVTYPYPQPLSQAERWAKASGEGLLALCREIGVLARFCQNGQPPTYEDRGLAERLARNPMPRGGLFMSGPVNGHKSHLMAARCVDAARRGWTAYFLKWGWFCLEVRDTYKPNSQRSEADILERYRQFNYLGIDDLGTGRPDRPESEAALRLAYELFDGRYERCLTTDVTSNLTPDELAGKFDERIARRISEMCTTYVMLVDEPGNPSSDVEYNEELYAPR